MIFKLSTTLSFKIIFSGFRISLEIFFAPTMKYWFGSTSDQKYGDNDQNLLQSLICLHKSLSLHFTHTRVGCSSINEWPAFTSTNNFIQINKVKLLPDVFYRIDPIEITWTRTQELCIELRIQEFREHKCQGKYIWWTKWKLFYCSNFRIHAPSPQSLWLLFLANKFYCIVFYSTLLYCIQFRHLD